MKDERFKDLLDTGIRNIAANENKPVNVIEDEIGFALGREGRHAVQHWRKGNVPDVDVVRYLARECVKRGNRDYTWAKQFLFRGLGIGEEGFLTELFPEQHGTSGEIRAELKLQDERRRAETISDDPALAESNLELGNQALKKGQLKEAESFYEQAEAIYARTGDKTGRAQALMGIAEVHAAGGNKENWKKAISIVFEIKRISTDPYILGNAKLRGGICERKLGEYKDALGSLEDCLKQWRMLKDKLRLGETYVAIGDVYRKQNDWGRAKKSFNAGRKILLDEFSRRTNSPDVIYHLAQANFALGRVSYEEHQYDEAEKLLQESFNASEYTGNFSLQEQCAQFMGRLYKEIGKQNKDSGKLNEARRWLHESYVANYLTNHDQRRVETLYYVVELAVLMNQRMRALKFAASSIADANSLGLERELARLLVLYGQISSEEGSTEDALRSYKEAILTTLRSGPSIKEEIFSRIRENLRGMTGRDMQLGAQYIILELIKWWPAAETNGKMAIADEQGQIQANMKVWGRQKRIQQYLIDMNGDFEQ